MASIRFTLPMTAAGGAFLMCVGVGLIVLAFAPPENRGLVGVATVIAAALALVGIAFVSSKLGFGRPTRGQITILYSAIAAEILLIWLLAPRLEGERMLWIGVLAMVGLHFFPMYWTHGIRIALLGLCCIAVAVVGLLAPGIPLSAVIASDGALKVAFGLWMLSALNRPSQAAGAAK